MLPIGDLATVDGLEHARLYLFGEEHVGRYHHVVAGVTGQQLGFEGFVGVENVIDQFDLGIFLEVHQGLWRDVVEPVVHTQGALFVSLCGTGEQGGTQQGSEEAFECVHARASC
ncbi:hypothetical protein D9M71_648060 [compost metagenome]